MLELLIMPEAEHDCNTTLPTAPAAQEGRGAKWRSRKVSGRPQSTTEARGAGLAFMFAERVVM